MSTSCCAPLPGSAGIAPGFLPQERSDISSPRGEATLGEADRPKAEAAGGGQAEQAEKRCPEGA